MVVSWWIVAFLRCLLLLVGYIVGYMMTRYWVRKHDGRILHEKGSLIYVCMAALFFGMIKPGRSISS